MLGKERFGSVVNLLMNVVLGIVLILVGYWRASIEFSFVPFLQAFCISMGVGFLIGEWVPGMVWGTKLADAFNIHNKLLHHMVSVLVLALCMITLVSFTIQFINFGTEVFTYWIAVYPYFIGFGYIALCIFLPIAVKIADSLTSAQVGEPQPQKS